MLMQAATLDEDQLDAMFAALADRTRRGIIARLTQGEATVGELAEPYDMSLQAVSQHIRVLQHAGLVSRGRERQMRPCRLEPAALQTAASWIEENRRLWSERLDRLETHLLGIQDPRGRAQP